MNTEQLYKDFTEKLLPQIQEGLSITKDYFLDLFGRYVKYLLVVDSFWMIFGLIMFVGGCYSFYRAIKYGQKEENQDCGMWEVSSIFWVIDSAIIILIGFITFGCNLENLAKDIYIPEIRIYEELKGFVK